MIDVVRESLSRVLVIEDERPIRRLLQTLLGDSWQVLEAETGQAGLELAASARPDILILDLGLPDQDGLDVLRRLREWSQVPVIVISVRDREQDKVAALDAGADDFLTKPFGAGELTARMRAALRRAVAPETMAVYRDRDLMVDLTRREVRVADSPVGLTPTEYDLLRVMVQHAGKVLTHQQLIQTVWGGSQDAGAHLLRVNVSNLRRKIEKDPLRPQHILTEPGVGYRLMELERL